MTPPIRTEPRHEVPGVHLQFSAARFVRLFAIAAASLCLLHILLHFVAVVKGDGRLYGLVYIFGLGAERNVPTLYSTLALLVVAGLLLVIARHSKTDRLYWWVLGGTFVFLALDETMGFHEKLVGPVGNALKTSGAFHYAWIIPYGLAALAFGIAFSRFLLRLPRKTAIRFVVAGAIFVAGAVGMEMVGGVAIEQNSDKHWTYWSAQTAEESLEMLGVLLFLHAIVNHIDGKLGGLTLRLGNAPAPGTGKTMEMPGPAPREAAKRRLPDAAS